MQVQRVQNKSNNNYKPAFKAAIVEKSAAKVIESMSESEQKDFYNILQRIENTKFWDLRLRKVIRDANEFCCDFVNKKNPKKVYNMGIHPINAKGSKVEIFPVVAPDNSKMEKIEFSSPQRAQAMIDKHKRHNQEIIESNFKSTNLQRLTRWVENLESLDEAYRYMKLGEVYPLDGTQNVTVKKPTIIKKVLGFFGWS